MKSNFGINKIRLSGGEPLLRKNIDHLVKDLVNIKKIKSVNETYKARIVTDYIAGMTDRFALEEHRRQFSLYE